ncbi:MAG: hypothetical protein IPI46_09395 [Bacteroidetes bacterium]|nr:hypothetical protein [Bacteroidota bacterium]
MIIKIVFVLIFTIGCQHSYAQMDTAGLRMINIMGDTLKGFKSEAASYQRIIGNVVITHENSRMTCDSAHFYFDENMVEAYSNVIITGSNGTQAQSDYIKYTGMNSTALMTGNVQIHDISNTLYSNVVTYTLNTKIGKYFDGGTLQTEETTVSSNEGTYNGTTKQAYFKNEVLITNPKYIIESKELTYNTNSKVIKFLDESRIMSEKDTVITSAGVYDSKNEEAFFTKRTTIQNKDQIIAGNTMQYNDKTGFAKASGRVVIEQEGGKQLIIADETEYNKKTGYAKAMGRVVILDTAEKSRLICGKVEFNNHSKFMLATVDPKLITLVDKDSLYMRADTIMSIRVRDINNLKRTETYTIDKKQKTKLITYNLLLADSTFIREDSIEPKLMMANHQVKIFSDSLQAVCDSLTYSQTDSSFSLFVNPVMWNQKQQGNADTIYLHTKQNKLSEVNLRNASMLIIESAQHKYDQMAGKYIDAYFTNNQINWVHIDQNAECIYYAKDEKGAYLGLNKAESAKIKVFFENKELDHLVFIENPKGSFIPIDKIGDKDKLLETFKLFTERRPQSKSVIMED